MLAVYPIVLVSLVATYFLSDYVRLPQLKWLFIVGAAWMSFREIPQWFFPPPEPDGIQCGNPILAITLGAWFLGMLSIVMSWPTYWILRKIITALKKD